MCSDVPECNERLGTAKQADIPTSNHSRETYTPSAVDDFLSANNSFPHADSPHRTNEAGTLRTTLKVHHHAKRARLAYKIGYLKPPSPNDYLVNADGFFF